MKSDPYDPRLHMLAEEPVGQRRRHYLSVWRRLRWGIQTVGGLGNRWRYHTDVNSQCHGENAVSHLPWICTLGFTSEKKESNVKLVLSHTVLCHGRFDVLTLWRCANGVNVLYQTRLPGSRCWQSDLRDLLVCCLTFYITLIHWHLDIARCRRSWESNEPWPVLQVGKVSHGGSVLRAQ